ncbi:hypothetical protein [uncultured Brevundimonas sp.]|uniref:hypothetical protein n=1 Tax=uncultured Brevundimonas sp. TaxID=213418 RepID=UPI0026057FC3|nr:hypothetical protein [uncultured Brevundimonas sp.]
MRVRHDSLNHKVSRQILAGIAACVAVLSASTAAQAGPDMGIDPILPANYMEDPRSLDLIVYGVIPSRCALGSGRTIDFGDLTVPKEADAPLGLTCNVPFDLTIRAQHGALSHESLPGGQGGFSGRLAYGLSVDVPLLAPAHRNMTGRFESAQLQGGVTLSSDGAIAAGGAYLQFQTMAAEGHGLLSGQYSETIVLTIAPRM